MIILGSNNPFITAQDKAMEMQIVSTAVNDDKKKYEAEQAEEKELNPPDS